MQGSRFVTIMLGFSQQAGVRMVFQPQQEIKHAY